MNAAVLDATHISIAKKDQGVLWVSCGEDGNAHNSLNSSSSHQPERPIIVLRHGSAGYTVGIYSATAPPPSDHHFHKHFYAALFTTASTRANINMFDIIADLLTTLLTILFPIFASYKALSSSDLALLTPWLHYWILLSLATLLESHLFILSYFPFYAWIRLAIHLYLLLPGETQGATYLYNTYVHPFLSKHEADIEDFISTGHDRAKKLGMDYLKRLLDFIKLHALGLQPQPSPAAAPTATTSYASRLFARFSLPSAREAARTTDIYALLSTALQAATSSVTSSVHAAESGSAHAMPDLTASGTLVPPDIAPEERQGYIAAQRERLRVLLLAFEREAMVGAGAAAAVAPALAAPATATMADFGVVEEEVKRSKSEVSFQTIDSEDATEVVGDNAGITPAGDVELGGRASGWGAWIWARKVTAGVENEKEEARAAAIEVKH